MIYNSQSKQSQVCYVRRGFLCTIKRLLCLILVALCLLGFTNKSKLETRHALIIGNSNYGSGFSLSNPFNDATAIAEKLSSIGYVVHKDRALVDLQIDEFNDEIDSFLNSVEDGSSVLIYYAGHGSASAGENFLIPILPDGVKLGTESDIRNRSISLSSILERVQRYNSTGINVLFIDACRDAPVANFSRSINLTGLTSLDTRWQPQGSFVGFSTEYGKVAVDGDGSEYSPFASAMLNNLDTRADTPIELFFKNVSNEVYKTTEGQQFPIQEPKIRGDYCLIPCKSVESGRDADPEFGYLTVVTEPKSAEVCYRVEDEWQNWNCGQQMVLPVGKPTNIRVTAKNYHTYETITVLRDPEQQLMVNLKRESRRAYKIAGAIAAIVVTGLLMSNRSDSSSEGGYQITLTTPIP